LTPELPLDHIPISLAVFLHMGPLEEARRARASRQNVSAAAQDCEIYDAAGDLCDHVARASMHKAKGYMHMARAASAQGLTAFLADLESASSPGWYLSPSRGRLARQVYTSFNGVWHKERIRELSQSLRGCTSKSRRRSREPREQRDGMVARARRKSDAYRS